MKYSFRQILTGRKDISHSLALGQRKEKWEWEVIANDYGISFWSDENVQKLIVVIVAQSIY